MTRLTGEDQEERTQQKTSRIAQSRLTNENPALREVDSEPSAKRGTNRTNITSMTMLRDFIETCEKIFHI